jgi:OOP family OmpA-OmpF porin
MSSRLAALLALVSVVPIAATADDPTKRGFDADPARLAFSLDGNFTVETARTTPRGTHALGALLDLTDGLLTLRLDGQSEDLIPSRLSLHLFGGWSFGDVEVAAELPVALDQASNFSLLTDAGVTGPLVAPIASTAVGDLRLGAKAKMLDEGDWPVGIALLFDLRLPTGDKQAFYGDGLAFGSSLVATRTFGKVRVDGQLGYIFRGAGQYAQLVVHDGITYGLAGSLDLPPLKRIDRWRAIAELGGGWPRGDVAGTTRYSAPLGIRGGLRAWLTPRWSVEAGAGTGLGEVGYGRERWRVFGGVRWTAEPPPTPTEGDDDGDGIPNAKDRCPKDPGPAALGGCPDTDGDGIPDIDDDCPLDPGPPENNGCPLPEAEPLVEIQEKRLSLSDSIHFDTGLDTIKKDSFPVLDQVARLINEHGELKKIRVEGHTDNVGGADYNKGLSGRRAGSVMRYLLARGVAPSRLEAAGYGFDRPVASNDTPVGRAKNRRVEFTIVGDSGAK